MSNPGQGQGKGQGQGRGRGEAPALLRMEEEQQLRPPVRGGGRPPSGEIPILEPERSSSSSSSDAEKTVRGRGGFKPKESRELYTIPPDINAVRVEKGGPNTGQPCELLSNFVRIAPMAKKEVIKYRIDFEPVLESVPMRRAMFKQVAPDVFHNNSADFDGVSDARSPFKTQDKTITKVLKHPVDDSNITMTIKQVGIVAWASQEMVRLYNMNMKSFLRIMGFFQINKIGAYVHPDLSKAIGTSNTISMIGGFKTACNIHEEGQILMNLESTHKLMQRINVLQYMSDLKDSNLSLPQIKERLVGKLVVTSYNRQIYKVEDVNFDLSGNSKFKDHKSGNDITYCEYYTNRYQLNIKPNQPLLLGVPNARNLRGGEENREIYLVPELCNIAGLTDQQRTDNRLKVDLIRASQVNPQDLVTNLRTFLSQLHNNTNVKDILNKWAYNYDRDLVSIKARILPLQKIGAGKGSKQNHNTWPGCDNMGGFEGIIMRETLAKVPVFKKMYVLLAKNDLRNEGAILGRLRGGFNKVGLVPEDVKVDRIAEGDTPHMYVNYLKRIPADVTAAIVILSHQNKDRYDAVKKLCAVERGIVTQVVTSRLMMDERKAGGASTKIAIQIAAKIGGEPWYNYIPLQAVMVCGYDTYHDTAKRGRSFGAFLASMNQQRSRWWSKADSHEHIDELSSHVAENMVLAMGKWKELNNGKWPERIILYRDGVGDGQIPHVFEVELDQIKKAIASCSDMCKLTFIIVNKRIGARFFMKNNNTFINPPPGTVVDDVVTRRARYDFYLVSQSTRQGTVSPTYYNIIYDTSGLETFVHQLMAYKMCFMYYNWTGTVRVPAPCQYAHKLALLCGEHLHAVPNTQLDDRLHFL